MPRKVTLVPTAHISQKSIDDVRRAILETRPDLVAVELCPLRYRALLAQKSQPSKLFLRGKVFVGILSLLQKCLSRQIGIFPGSEMLEAIRLARRKNIPVALIDQPIQETIRNLRQVPLSEKVKLLLFSLPAPFLGRRIRVDELTNPVTLSALMEAFRSRAPVAYRVLVTDRNKYMALQLKHTTSGNILAVVGAGHAPGIQKILNKK